MIGRKEKTVADIRTRPGQFLDDIQYYVHRPRVRIPDPEKDCGMYQAMNNAFAGLHEQLEQWQRSYGRVGYGSANLMSDLSKEAIELAQHGDEEETLQYSNDAMRQLVLGFQNAVEEAQLPDEVTKFGSTIAQEYMEAVLFQSIWPVVVERAERVPELPIWENFEGNAQAYLYGYLDAVTEMAKAVTEALSESELTLEQELSIFKRYLAIADSIVLRLSQERHFPGYVIANGYGRFMAYAQRFRGVQGAIAHVRREYNLRLFHLRLNRVTTSANES